METLLAWSLMGVSVAVAIVAIRRLLAGAATRRPETETAGTRDQIIAQNRVFSGRQAKPGEAAWDGIRRTALDTQPGTGVE